MTPRGAGPDGPAQGVEAVMEVGDALTGLFGRQAKGGADELPVGVGVAAGIGLVGIGLVCDPTLSYIPNWNRVH
jgi:hypothetical protein